MKLNELQPKQGNINITVEVVEKGDVREFTKFGKTGRVCNATVKDDSGKMKLTLWNEDVDKVNAGDTVKLVNGYVNEFRGEMQLTSGRAGKIEVIESSESEPEQTESVEPEEVEDEGEPEEEDLDVEEEII